MSLAGDAPRYKATRAYRARRSATRPNGTRIFGVSKNRDWRPVGRRRSSRPLILIYDNRDRDLLSQTDRIIGSGVRASRSVRFCYRSRPTDSHETSLALRSSLRACIASIVTRRSTSRESRPRAPDRVHEKVERCWLVGRRSVVRCRHAWERVRAPFIRWRIYAGGRKTTTDHGTARPYDEPRARTGSATGAKRLRAIPSQRLHGTSRIRSRTVEPVRDGACQPNNRLG